MIKLRDLKPLLLLALTYVTGQAYLFFSHVKLVQNWILCQYKPMLVEWNVKFLSEEVNRIIEAIAFRWMVKKILKWADNKGIRASERFVFIRFALVEYLWYRVLDLCAYFYDFKTQRYWYVFAILTLIMAYNWRKQLSYTSKTYN